MTAEQLADRLDAAITEHGLENSQAGQLMSALRAQVYVEALWQPPTSRTLH